MSGLFGIGQALLQNKFNKDEASKNRDFQSDEAAKNRLFQSNEAALQRNWSAAEAERARDWQEEQYEKYNSISGKIAQAEQAGVNPMFAVTDSAVSPVSASASSPSGASAGSVGTPSGSQATSSFVDIVGQVLGFKKLQSQINVDNALAEKYRKEAENTGWLSKLNEREYNIVTEHNFDVRTIESKLSVDQETANYIYQNAGKVFEEASKLSVDTEFARKTMDDRVKSAEYDKLIKEFESSISSVFDKLDSGEKASLSDWIQSILRGILVFK